MSGDAAVSVVMSVYNGAETLGETLDSIVTQRGVEMEIIIVDDGSTDDSGRILDAYASRDARVRVIHQPNAGLTRALIAGCAAARGRYNARHDAGDLSAPDRFLRQAAALDEHGDVSFVSCWTAYAGPNLEPLYLARGRGRASSPIDILDLSAPHCVIDGPSSHPSVMFRRDAYARAGGYRAAFRFGQDWDLWYRLGAIGKFLMIDDVLYTARVEPRSISMSSRPAQRELAAISEALVRVRAAGGSEEELLERAARITSQRSKQICAEARGLYFIGEALRQNRDRRCRGYLFRAALSCPMLLRAWLRLLQSLTLRPR
jgi:glycosyltransferase involved in cell wall biosynthesis